MNDGESTVDSMLREDLASMTEVNDLLEARVGQHVCSKNEPHEYRRVTKIEREGPGRYAYFLQGPDDTLVTTNFDYWRVVPHDVYSDPFGEYAVLTDDAAIESRDIGVHADGSRSVCPIGGTVAGTKAHHAQWGGGATIVAVIRPLRLPFYAPKVY